MIPSIEQILYDLMSGKIDGVQAEQWINQHIELARGDVDDLRDHFAGLAMQVSMTEALSVAYEDRTPEWMSNLAEDSYDMADKMLQVRQL